MENTAISNEIKIVGIEIRTTFKNGKHFKDIPELWENTMKNNYLNTIPNRIDDSIYCIYHNYETEDQGEYSVLLGVSVKNGDQIPKNYVSLSITPGNYKVYYAKTQDPKETQGIWENIWQQSKSEYKRAFKTDFDHYSTQQISVFVGYN